MQVRKFTRVQVNYLPSCKLASCIIEEVPQEGIEPPTYRLEVCCSIR